MKAARPLWRVSVTVPIEAEERIIELMSGVLDAPASSYHKAEAAKVTVAVFLDEAPPRTILQALRLELGRTGNAPGRIKVRRIRREDWAESWKKHFPPLLVGSRLMIKPSWSRRRALPGQRVVVLDPGLSFGTGHHPTTEFCLRQVIPSAKGDEPRSFLDLGTGSGILAIAAAKFGYRPILGIDFDPDAVRIARENARRNRMKERIEFQVADLTRLPVRSEHRYELVCANLISTLLIGERRRIVARVADAGALVLAGILRREFASVAAAYEEIGFRLTRQSSKGEWTSGRFERLG